MKNLAIILAVVLTISGCAQLQTALDVVSTSTASIANPVTKDRLNDVENAAIIAFAGLNAYKRSCVERAIPSSCRTVIQKIQVYTRKLPQQLVNLRNFVNNNDQVNAITAYNAVTQALSDFRNVAIANNVPLTQVQ